MNLLGLLHNEKIVRYLENIDTQLKDLTEPATENKSIFLKIILIIETLLKNNNHTNSHIGEYFEKYYDNQRTVDDLHEKIKLKNVEIEELKYRIQDIIAELEGLNWEPKKIQDWIEESSNAIDYNSTEGFVFEILKEELINNKKLNYNYGRKENQ